MSEKKEGGTGTISLKASAFITLLDAAGVGILMPLMPFLVLHFGGSPIEVASLVMVFGLCGMIGGPFLGSLSDSFGRRPIILTSSLAIALSYLGMGFAWSLGGVFVFRSIAGLLSGRGAVLRTLMTDGQASDVQVARIGLLTSVGAIGAALGPALAALPILLTSQQADQYVGTLGIAVALNILAFGLATAFLPNGTARAAASPGRIEKQGRLALLAIPEVRTPVMISGGVALAQGVTMSVTALYVKQAFGWGVPEVGALLSGMAVAIALSRFLLFKRGARVFGLDRLLVVSLLLAAPALALIGLVENAVAYLAGMVIFHVGISIAGVVPVTQISLQAPLNLRGFAQGLNHGATTLCLAISAGVSGVIYSSVSPAGPFLAGAFLLVAMLIVLGMRGRVPVDSTGVRETPSGRRS